MNFRNFLFRISQITVILMALGWAAVVYTAKFLPGGHPPLSALVGIAVIVSSWILGSVGALCGLAGMHVPQRNWGRALFVVLNAGLLGFAILVNFV